MKVRKSLSKPRASLALKKPKAVEESPIKKSNKKKLKNAAGVVYPPENLVEPDLDLETVTKAAEKMLELDEKNAQDKVSLLGGGEGEPICLNLSFYKIADIPSRLLRIELPHSLVQETTDVAMIVRDLEPKSKSPDHDSVIQMYESRLRAHGIKHPIKIITLRQVMTEYKTFEAKRKLCNSFDMFLADCSISCRLMPTLGKSFSAAKKNPHPVHTEPVGLMKTSVQKALNKTILPLNAHGDCRTVKIGHTKMEASQIAENVVAAVKVACKEIPGGWFNVRNMFLKSLRSPSVPFYCAIRDPNEIKITGVRKTLKHNKPVEDELTTTTIENFKVRVKPDGSVEMIDDKGNLLSKKRTLLAMKDFDIQRKRKYAVSDAVILASEEGDEPEEKDEEKVKRVVPKSAKSNDDSDADMDAEHADDDDEKPEAKKPKKEKASKKGKKAKLAESDDEEEQAATLSYEESYLNQLEHETKEKIKAKKATKKANAAKQEPAKKTQKKKANKPAETQKPAKAVKQTKGQKTTSVPKTTKAQKLAKAEKPTKAQKPAKTAASVKETRSKSANQEVPKKKKKV